MKMRNSSIDGVRGRFFDFSKSVGQQSNFEGTVRYVEDGLLLLKEGHIEWFGDWSEGREQVPEGARIHEYPDKVIVPGFIDCHIHFPQAEIIAAYGEQLLEWLNNYAFPAEKQYGDKSYSMEMAEVFVAELLRNGTTTAAVFCTVHQQSAEALFAAAQRVNMRVIAGKVMMDRDAPPGLLDTPATAYDDSRLLIEKYHNQGRLLYAVTPRFAPTSTPEQLAVAGRLVQEYPNLYMQTHLSENIAEIEWVQELFPDRESYLDVYEHYGLTGPRSIFGHCIHLEDAEWTGLFDTDSVIAFCPTSNLFLGSGLFDLERARREDVRVGMATDVGGGTSFSILSSLSEAYKVMQLQRQKFSAFEAFYMATLGGAEALSLDHLLGNFNVGKEADFVVLDPAATVLQAKRSEKSKNIADLLFALMVLGDDRTVFRTYVDGRLVHRRE